MQTFSYIYMTLHIIIKQRKTNPVVSTEEGHSFSRNMTQNHMQVYVCVHVCVSWIHTQR